MERHVVLVRPSRALVQLQPILAQLNAEQPPSVSVTGEIGGGSCVYFGSVKINTTCDVVEGLRAPTNCYLEFRSQEASSAPQHKRIF